MIKHFCTNFFYYWYNQPGNNTEQGFDDWIKINEGQLLLNNFKEQIKKVFKNHQCLMHEIDNIPDFSITEDKYNKIINEILNLK